MTLSVGLARELVDQAAFIWYQRFELAPGVFTPGARDVAAVVDQMGIATDLTGKTVLDVGTTNGGVAFALEQRGASRVVAVDIYPPERFGFTALKTALSSRAEFVQANIYELPSLLPEKFDIVVFLGVLYHLRHPLLALDNVRQLTRGEAFIETEVADSELPGCASSSVVRFYRRDERAMDASNWFAPTINCLLDWCWSSGLEPELQAAWPDPATRCLVKVRPTPGEAEFASISYEQPLRVQLGS